MQIQVIHFTEGAANPLLQSKSRKANFVPLADGTGDTHLSCLHIAAGGRIPKLPVLEPSVLLVVHGTVEFTARSGMRLDLCAGVGVVLQTGEDCALVSPAGAIIIVVQAQQLEAHESGVSMPDRIWHARWPGETSGGSSGSR